MNVTYILPGCILYFTDKKTQYFLMPHGSALLHKYVCGYSKEPVPLPGIVSGGML